MTEPADYTLQKGQYFTYFKPLTVPAKIEETKAGVILILHKDVQKEIARLEAKGLLTEGSK